MHPALSLCSTHSKISVCSGRFNIDSVRCLPRMYSRTEGMVFTEQCPPELEVELGHRLRHWSQVTQFPSTEVAPAPWWNWHRVLL